MQGEGWGVISSTMEDSTGDERFGIPDIQIQQETDMSGLKKWYAKCCQGVGKLHYYSLKLHIDDNVQPVAQLLHTLPFSVQDAVEQKLASSTFAGDTTR